MSDSRAIIGKSTCSGIQGEDSDILLNEIFTKDQSLQGAECPEFLAHIRLLSSAGVSLFIDFTSLSAICYLAETYAVETLLMRYKGYFSTQTQDESMLIYLWFYVFFFVCQS